MTKARLKQFQKVELQKPKYEPSANLRHPHPTDFDFCNSRKDILRVFQD